MTQVPYTQDIREPSATYAEFLDMWMRMMRRCHSANDTDIRCGGREQMVAWQPTTDSPATAYPLRLCCTHLRQWQRALSQGADQFGQQVAVLDDVSAGAMAYAMAIADYRTRLSRPPLTLWECPNCGMPYAYETRCVMASCKGDKVWMSVDVAAARSTLMSATKDRSVVRPARRPKARA